ncbi:MAG: NAD-dependent epimerase/dehydratase family protein [Polyangiales bacterium]|nr:NAD-dependent epimerase/dehydratase family protein [Myxococcales bacterium]
MRVFLTGATGFLGAHLLTALRSAGHDVRVWARASSDVSGLGDVEVRRGSLHDGDALAVAMAGCDAVLHAAGGGKVLRIAEVYRDNAESTATLLDAAERAGVTRFALVSSLAAGGGGPRPRTERDAPRPASHYGKSKLLAERHALDRRERMRVVVVRPPAVYGPGDTRMVPLFSAAARGVLPMVEPNGSLSLVYGADCARALVLALEADVPSGRVYYVSDGEPYARREFARLIGAAVGRSVRVVPVPTAAVVVAGALNEAVGRLRERSVVLSRDKVADIRVPHQTCDAAFIRAELGWAPTLRFDEGARVTAEAYRDAGWLTR